jgi:hypothetical protein
LDFVGKGNSNPFREFGEYCTSFKRSATAFRRADLRGLLNMASLTPSILSDVGAENGRHFGILLDGISIATVADYCSKEHHVFETAVGNHSVYL